jgi:hypothetical protein
LLHVVVAVVVAMVVAVVPEVDGTVLMAPVDW